MRSKDAIFVGIIWVSVLAASAGLFADYKSQPSNMIFFNDGNSGWCIAHADEYKHKPFKGDLEISQLSCVDDQGTIRNFTESFLISGDECAKRHCK